MKRRLRQQRRAGISRSAGAMASIAAVIAALLTGLLLPPSPALGLDAPTAPPTASPTPPTTTTVAAPPGGVQLGPSTSGIPPSGGASTATTTPGGVAGSGRGSPGIFDIPGRLRQAINDWFRDLVASALTPTLNLLGQSVLATPDVAGPGRVRDLWTVSAGLANTCFVLLVLAGGVLVMAHETLQTRTSIKEVAPRIVVAFVAANASLALAGVAIRVANALSQALLGQGADPVRAGETIQRLALEPLAAGGIFLVLVAGVVAVLALLLVGAWVVRVSMVILLVAAAPLALASHALPQTEGLALLWWRAFTACLGVQVGQSLVLVTAVRVFFDADGRQSLGLTPGRGDLVDLVLVACLLWILLRIPVWAGRAVFTSRRTGLLVRIAQAVVITRIVRRALGTSGGGGGRGDR